MDEMNKGVGACAESHGCSCKCPHHMVPALLVVVFGLLFLLGDYGVVSGQVVTVGWPILVVLAGVMKLGGRMCKCC